MKKIISVSALILIIAIIATAFAACGDKKEDETTTQPTTAATQNAFAPTITISEDGAMVAYGDGKIQKLSFPEGYENEYDFEYAKEHYDFVDLNFDKVLDISIAIAKNGDEISFYCWLYDSVTNGYVYSKELSALKNISVDADKKQILSTKVKNGKETVKVYSWVEGKLTEQKSYGENGETVPPAVSETIKNNTVGTDKKPSTGSTTKPNASKPAGTTKPNSNKPTTTTKPSGGVQIAEGDPDEGWY